MSNRTLKLVEATLEGNINKVQTLLEEGADVNAKANNGATALHIASEYRHPDIVEILLANGANVNTKTYNGVSALQNAESRGYTEIVQLLKDAGARD